MRRMALVAATALLIAACGGSDAADTTAPGAPPGEFLLLESDSGAVLEVNPGDLITVRLPVDDPADPRWVISRAPDPAVLETVDSLLWVPSEPGAEATQFEFVFLVTGAGETGVLISHGGLTTSARIVEFTVVSAVP